MKKTGWFNIATATVGTLIGAGFASGQELMQFFGDYGTRGLIMSAFAGVAFSAIAVIIMLTARNLGTISYEEISTPPVKVLRVGMNIYITFMLSTVLIVMIAGSGAMGHALFNVSPVVGNAVMAAALLITGVLGSDRLLRSFNFIVPVMTLIALVAAVLGIIEGPDDIIMGVSENASSLSGNFLSSGILYIGYNYIALTAVLSPLGVGAKNRRNIIAGSVAGGLSLGLIAVLLSVSIVKNYSLVSSEEMPVLTIARMSGPAIGTLYSGALFLAIFATGVGFLYGLLKRFSQYSSGVFRNQPLVTAAIVVTAFALSNFGFSGLISVIYPISGYVSLVALVLLVINYVRSIKKPERTAHPAR